MTDRVKVAVGVIYNSTRDKILIARRKKGQHLAGLWEFPGGKVQSNEDVDTALKRELHEELGIEIKKTEPLLSIKHDYPEKKVLLDVHTVLEWKGDVQGREGQEIVWVPVSEIKKYSFPEANKLIVSLLLFPPVYLISQPDYKDVNYLLNTLKKCFDSGLKLFQLRLASREKYQFDELIQDVKQLAEKNNARLILNGKPEDIELYKIDGIHLKSDEIFNYTKRPIGNNHILGASCHSTIELQQAISIDVDYLFISPVKKTGSHPERNALGWNKFEQLCELTNIPVYALGGMLPADILRAKAYGAQGIAMLSAVWDSKFPDEQIRSCTISV